MNTQAVKSPLPPSDTPAAPLASAAIRTIGAHYQRPAGESYHDSQFNIPDGIAPWITSMRAAKFQRFIKPTDTVAEYGVGHGWNLAGLKCARKIGYDITDTIEQVVRSHGIDFARSWAALPDTSVDVVICHHVLEHVPQPLETLTEIRRVLKPGGTFILVVPHETERWLNTYNPDEPNRHVYSWNVQSIGNLVHLSGFAVGESSIRRYGYDRAAAVLAQKLKLPETAYHAIRSVALMFKPRREICIVSKRSN